MARGAMDRAAGAIGRMNAANWVFLAILSTLWGGSFLFVELALQGLPVLTIVWLRVAGAAAVLGLWLASAGPGFPRGARAWGALAVMGVLKPCHRKGYGRALVDAAVAYARQTGYEFMQVKTVQMGKYEEYDRTNRFYLSCGFKEFEVFPTLWDEWNPCQIYVLSLNR